MKKLLFLSLLVSVFAFGQNQRFIYLYAFQPDSTDVSSKTQERMMLDVTAEKSVFKSLDKKINDSIMRSIIETQMKNAAVSGEVKIDLKGKVNKAAVPDEVEKNYSTGKTYWTKRLGRDAYQIEIERKPEWRIMPEKQTVLGYTAQKAVTHFGGRDWTVWFSTDLPIPDGPFLLAGLPGLILKAEDKTGTQMLELVEVKKLPTENSASGETGMPNGGRMSFMNTKPLNITESQFKKVWKDYAADPMKEMRNMMSNMGRRNGGDGTMSQTIVMGPNGKTFDAKEAEKNVLERIKKNNNFLDFDLYRQKK